MCHHPIQVVTPKCFMCTLCNLQFVIKKITFYFSYCFLYILSLSEVASPEYLTCPEIPFGINSSYFPIDKLKPGIQVDVLIAHNSWFHLSSFLHPKEKKKKKNKKKQIQFHWKTCHWTMHGIYLHLPAIYQSPGHLPLAASFLFVFLSPSAAWSQLQFKLLQQNTTDWVVYKQQIFISHSSRGRKFKILMLTWFSQALFCITDFSLYPLLEE